MSFRNMQRKKIARKAVKTRQERERRLKNVSRALKAVKTIKESEKNYIIKLARLVGVGKENVFHHVGLPDFMVVNSQGNVSFYEIKPKKGNRERRLLNSYQKETVKRLLDLEIKDIYVVKYEQRGRNYCYDEPIRLTSKTLSEHCI